MIKKVGVIGAGTMGIGVTVNLALYGIQTVLVDVAEEALGKAQPEITKLIRFAPMLNKALPPFKPAEVLANVQLTGRIEDVADCDFIIENVTEDWDIKRKVYEDLERVCREEICFGVNTSCISITKVASLTSRPDRVIGMHFMNPVYMKPSLEVIRGWYTTDETVEHVKAFLAQIRKDAIVVNDYPGFVANRISHLYMNEAAFVVQDQVASPKQVDDIFKKCYGHTMGPLETADLIGLDTVVKSLKVLYESYQDSKFRCCPLLQKMVDAGHLGRKSGKGFYDYAK